MKRAIISALILFMLSLMVFPIYVYADGTTTTKPMTPYDWLNDEEKAYVSTVRASTATALGEINSLKSRLGGIVPDQSWHQDYYSHMNALSSAIESLASLTPPAEFAGFQIGYFNINIWDEGFISSTAIDAIAQSKGTRFLALVNLVSEAGGALDSVQCSLNAMTGRINSKIADIAKRRELANKMIGNIFDSCMQRPARPY